jgi:hypothetical protein
MEPSLTEQCFYLLVSKSDTNSRQILRAPGEKMNAGAGARRRLRHFTQLALTLCMPEPAIAALALQEINPREGNP